LLNNKKLSSNSFLSSIIKEAFLLFVSVILLYTVSYSKPSKSKVLPNIIIILNDDMGYQDLGCFGSPNIKTPRVDKLSKEGMRFTDFYVASPVCSASRASLLTGCYPQNVGVKGVFFPNTGEGLEPSNVTLAEVLSEVGYATAAIGKWHLGDQKKYLPTNQGFNSYYGIPYSNDMYAAKNMKYSEDCLFREGYSAEKILDAFNGEIVGGQPKALKNKVPLMRNEECIEYPCDQTTVTKRYTDESIEFINRSVQEEKPFFLYLANTMPHIPIFTSEKFKGKSERGLYGDAIEEIDYNTGRILDKLKQLGIEENTIVIFTSDNGPWLGVGKENEGCALPLFEGKFTSFDGGMRVPFIIRWPGKIPANSTCSQLASTIDLVPTLANITGAKLTQQKIDGMNILDLWMSKDGAKTPHEFYFYAHTGQAVRSGDWKYHKKQVYTVTDKALRFEGPALYNLKNDIGESQNVIDQYPEITKRLANALEEHLQEISK